MPVDPHALAGRTILVLEDEYFLADDLASAIQSAGGDVQGPFAASSDALAYLAGGSRPDAVTMNINVADGLSYGVADELMRVDIPFVFASAYSPASLPARFSRAPILIKPFNAIKIVEALAAIISSRAVARSEASKQDDSPAA